MRKIASNLPRARQLIMIAGAAIAPLIATDVHAQKSPSGKETASLQEVVVTARRVTERLQDVPGSVAAISPQTIAQRQISNLNDVRQAVVGLTVLRTTTPGGGVIAIRGYSNTSLGRGLADNSIGYYLDGVYMARLRGAGTDVPDLDRIEVLRGPQGTLFGRNSTAGTINFITNEPKQTFEASADLLYGSYDQFRAIGIINIPINRSLAIRIAYEHNQDAGDVKNTSTSPGFTIAGTPPFTPVPRFNGYHSDSISARLKYTAGPLVINYKFDYAFDEERAGVSQIIGYLPSGFSNTLAAILPLQAPGAVRQSFQRLSDVSEQMQSALPIRSSGHLLNVAYRLNDHITLKSISSYRQLSSPGSFGLDGGDWRIPIGGGAFMPFCVTCTVGQIYNQHQFANEEQMLASYHRVSGIIGFYYSDEGLFTISPFMTGRVMPASPAVYQRVTSQFFGPGFGDLTLGEFAKYGATSYAGYGHLDIALTDALKLTGGLRYTADTKTADDMRSFGTGLASVSGQKLTYDVAMDYNIAADKMVYARYATGYVSGGLISNVGFKPETTQQAEAGFKTEFLDHRLRFNGAAYYTWIQDRQSGIVSVNPLSNPVLAAAGYQPPYPAGILIYNIPGTTKIDGFELEANLVPMRGLTLSANVGHSHTSTPSHLRVQVPATQVSFSGEYDLAPWSNGSYLAVSIDGDYRSTYSGSGLTVATAFTGDVPAALRPGYATSAAYLAALEQATYEGDYWLVNARVALKDWPVGHSSTRAQLAVFVRNILDAQNLLYVANYGATVNGQFEEPRTFGVELNVKY
jgi:iron complex outermembrane receptor protein